MQKDTYFRVYDSDNTYDISQETINGSGISDSLKMSNLHNITIKNKTFIGSPSENDIDCVRGGPYFFGPNDHSASKAGVSNITAKGAIEGLILTGNFGTVEFGQYSNYDRWFKLPKSKGIQFGENAEGKITIWFGEKPENIPSNVKIKKIPSFIVYAYFLFRSCQQEGHDFYIKLINKLFKK